MRKSLVLLFSLLGSFLIMTSLAPAGKIVYRYQAFLACEKTDSIMISVADFQRLMEMPLCAKDSAQNLVPVTGFEITYAERGLYQDSTGLPIIFTDYSNVICKGDTIPSDWKNRFKESGYKGDTVYFDRIQISDKNKSHFCKRIKCVIQ